MGIIRTYKKYILVIIFLITATSFQIISSQKPVSAAGSCYLTANGTSSLNWSSSGLPTGTSWVASLTRSGGGTTYGLPTSYTGYSISPPANTLSTYTIYIYQSGNTSNITAGCSVNVDTRTTPPPTCSITSNKYTVNKNETFYLSWSSVNATSASLNYYPTSVTGSNVAQNISSTTTYTLRVTGPGGSGSCGPITVTVNSGSSATCTAPDKTPVIGRTITTPSGGSGPVTVPYGTSGIDLLLSLSAYVCRTDESPVDTTYFQISSATPVGSISGLTGGSIMQTSFPWVVGATGYTADPFRFSPPGGFTTSGTYTVTVTGIPVNHFPVEGYYICVNNSGTRRSTLDFSACNPDTLTFTVQVNVQPPPNPAPTCNLSANPATINLGESSVLSWTSSNGTSWGFADSSTSVGATGNRTVTPSTTTTYYFLVVGPGGSQTCPATVYVNNVPPPPVPGCNIYASKSTINLGESTVLYWTSTNATGATLNNNAVSVNNTNGYTVTPTATTTYYFTAYGPGGSRTCPLTITVNGSSNPKPTCSITPGSITISEGQSVNLTWSSTWATSATLNDEPVNVNNSSGYNVTPTVSTTYTFIATGPGGSSPPCIVDITVENGPPKYTCQPIFYQSLANRVFSTDVLEMKRLSVGPPDYQKLYDITGPGLTNINAIGYNTQDDYIYGIGVIDGYSRVVRIDATGKATALNIVAAPNTSVPDTFNAYSVVGDFDGSGNLMIAYKDGSDNMRVFSIDISEGTYKRVQVANNSADINSLYGINDWVMIGNAFYGIRTSSKTSLSIPPQLIRAEYDSANNRLAINVVAIKQNPDTGTLPDSGVYGALWTTSDSKLYASLNAGKIYRINNYDVPIGTPDGATNVYAEEVVNGLPVTNGNDGASCPTAKDPLEKINYPFIRVNGSDVIAGAKFGDSVTSCAASTVGIGTIKANGYKNIPYNASITDDILLGSSSAQYAAFAKNKIDTDGGQGSSFLSNDGFYRSNSRRDLLFANNSGDYGYYYNDNSVPCVDITNIESKAENNIQDTDIYTSLNGSGANNRVMKTTQNLNISGRTISAGRHLTIITDGAVNITGNILFADGSSNNAAINVPSLTIIAKNGITIGSGVSQIAGTYIAQGSTLNTCSDLRTPTTSICTQKLTVNGMLVGKNIQWRRNYGTLRSDTNTLPIQLNGGEVRCSVYSKAGGEVNNVISAQNECSAELINFNPLYYFSSPFVGISNSTISNVPLSTVELPPIY